MRENKNTLIKITIVAIFMIISLIIPKNVLAISVGSNVYVTELWNKADGLDIYCTDHTHHLANNANYKVTEEWKIEGNIVKKNGTEINKNTDTKQWQTAIRRAYILSKPTADIKYDFTSIKKSLGEVTKGQERILKHGIYSVLDYKQEALWKIGTGKWNWADKEEGKRLSYAWTADGIKEIFNIERKDGKYKFAKTDSGSHMYMGDADKEITAVEFGDGKTNYYKKAFDLYKEANNYNGIPNVIVEDESLKSTNPDYNSDATYVIVGTFHLKHHSNVNVQNSVVSAIDNNGDDIKDSIVLSTKKTYVFGTKTVNGTDVTVKVKKSNLTTSIKSIKLQYSVPNVVKTATFYILKYSGGQNLITGSGTLGEYKDNIEVKLNKTLIPPVEINLTKASSLGGTLSGVNFEVIANQGTNELKKETITTSGGIAIFKCQPISRDTDVIITITEKTVPTHTTGAYQKLKKPMVITLKYDSTTNKWKAAETTDEENALNIKDNTKTDITITNQYISPIRIGGDVGGFNKVDQAGNSVVGAEFKAVYTQDDKEIFRETIKSDKIGKLDFSKVQPITTSNVTVTIEETTAPAGYVNSGYRKTIEFKYNATSHTWEPLANDINAEVEYKNNTTYVGIDDVVNQSQIDELTLIKRDSQDASKLVGAKFEITLTNIEKIKDYNIISDPAKITVTTNSNGELKLEGLVIKDVNDPVIITLEEILAPVGYKKIDGTITLTITRVGTKYTIVTSADETVINDDEFNAEITKLMPGDNGIVKGDVNKNGILDAGDALLVLKNSVGLYDFDENLKKIADVNGDGKVNSADAQWILSNKTPVPGSVSAISLGGKGDVNRDGKITEEDAELILKYSTELIDKEEIDLEKADVDENGVINSADALKILRYLTGEKTGASGNVTEENNKITIKMSDIPIMNLGGIVWAEKDKVGKAISLSDIYGDNDSNEEEALGGIKVKLLDKDDNVIATTTTATENNTIVKYLNNKGEEADANIGKGQYLFTKLDDGTNYIPVGTDYKVEIDYDGITYNALMNKDSNILYDKNGCSKITTEDDHGLAEGTKTISGTESESQSTTNGGYTIDYTLENNENVPDKAIYSKISKDGTQAFVTARSEKYLQKTEDWKSTWKANGEINLESYAFDINFGLYTKMFDLALGTDVESATVSINGQTTKYDYDQILDKIGMNEAYVEKKAKTADQYKENEIDVKYNLYLAYSDYYYRIEDYKVPGDTKEFESYDSDINKDVSELKEGTELNVNVTYKLLIKNQSANYPAMVTAKYYYDEGYKYIGEMENNEKKREILIKDVEIGPGETREIALEFNIEKDETGKFKKEPSDTSIYTNKAEIIEYTTSLGRLVDQDSAPGNFNANNETGRYEDDTDTANGIVVTFKKEAERSISGKVFDSSNNNAVDDVIVQLIELVEIENKQYEYIWQETVAGSDTVKTTARNGYSGENYSVTNGAGEYKFTERIIPGNYIVRFIYGDGRTYDIKDNTLKYNGEDYKSAYVNYDYNAEWYNTNTLNGENSKAVDNEARRLKVMSYAVDVDGTKGVELAKLDGAIDAKGLEDVLNNTWMCAETLKIKMPVDADAQENTSESTTVGEGSNPTIENTQFENVNFGLMERPKTKLVLEKHITGLTVKPVESGVRLIANATANIDDILGKNTGVAIELSGQKDGLSATKSGRDNRSSWYLQTDITELAQGADAYITYTYVVKNEGDEDYLNENLINVYQTAKIEGYAQKLSELELEVKDAKKSITGTLYKNGTYISDFYYTGIKGENDEKVLASVEQIQEALNPKVKFVNSTTDFTKADRKVETKYPYYDKDGNLQADNKNIKEIITSTTGTDKLTIKENNTSKKLVVSVGLSASEIENGGVYDSYIAQVTHYTNAAGRRDESTPDNLSYVHSEDTNKTLATNNEQDEFWAERFTITKPTGEDKLTPVQITIITISAVAVLGVGIILIKKFVIKK